MCLCVCVGVCALGEGGSYHVAANTRAHGSHWLPHFGLRNVVFVLVSVNMTCMCVIAFKCTCVRAFVCAACIFNLFYAMILFLFMYLVAFSYHIFMLSRMVVWHWHASTSMCFGRIWSRRPYRLRSVTAATNGSKAQWLGTRRRWLRCRYENMWVWLCVCNCTLKPGCVCVCACACACMRLCAFCAWPRLNGSARAGDGCIACMYFLMRVWLYVCCVCYEVNMHPRAYDSTN